MNKLITEITIINGPSEKELFENFIIFQNIEVVNFKIVYFGKEFIFPAYIQNVVASTKGDKLWNVEVITNRWKLMENSIHYKLSQLLLEDIKNIKYSTKDKKGTIFFEKH